MSGLTKTNTTSLVAGMVEFTLKFITLYLCELTLKLTLRTLDYTVLT